MAWMCPTIVDQMPGESNEDYWKRFRKNQNDFAKADCTTTTTVTTASKEWLQNDLKKSCEELANIKWWQRKRKKILEGRIRDDRYFLKNQYGERE